MPTPHYFDGCLRYRKTAQKKSMWTIWATKCFLQVGVYLRCVCVGVVGVACNIVVHRTEFGVA